MKTLLAGVKRVAGNAKAPPHNPFDICNVLALTPITVANGKFQVNGAGFEIMEIPLDASALPAFMKLTFPVQVELVLDHRPRFGKVEMICTGFREIAKAA